MNEIKMYTVLTNIVISYLEFRVQIYNTHETINDGYVDENEEYSDYYSSSEDYY